MTEPATVLVIPDVDNGYHNNTYYHGITNCVSNSAQVQYANVVPDATWTTQELTDFAQKYPGYTYEIVQLGITVPGLFHGIDIPVSPDVKQWYTKNREAEIAAMTPEPFWTSLRRFLKGRR